MIGQTLSHYRILDKLGQGGMGEVYLARDTQLKREVALKILPPEMAADPERLERFQREAEMLAALDHPNIVTIYSVEKSDGFHFLTMARVGGRTLDRAAPEGEVDLERLFELIVPIAGAVAAAHDKGITHRDLKPANIMVTEEGRVTILDFGLAKSGERPVADAEELPTEALTEAGLVLGTLPYMSPEQVKSQRLDPRSDVFSLGVILYELATGERPFRGATPADLISAILRDTPRPVSELNADLPHHLARIIRRCLRKDPQDRFQSARGLYHELVGLKKEMDSGEVRPSSAITAPLAPGAGKRWLAATVAAVVAVILIGGLLWLRPGGEPADPAREPPSASPAAAGEAEAPEAERRMIAILPFENQGPPAEAYFAAGVTEEITGRISAVSGLGVISRTTAAHYDRAGKNMRQVAADLGVDYVLDGTVRWAPGPEGESRVRITPQLVRADTDMQLWSETYDRVLDDIFAVQSDIAEKVIVELGVSLNGVEREALMARPTENLEAYQAYLQGMAYYLEYGHENQRRAIEMFERAADLDPEFVLAHAKIAQRSAWFHFQGDSTEDWLGKAGAALEQARALDADHPAVRLAEGYYHYYGFAEYDRALAAFEDAAAALPNDSEAIAAIAFIQRRQGRSEEALAGLKRAAELDPRNVELIWDLAATYRAFRRFEEAARTYDRGITLTPDNSLLYILKADNFVAWTGSTQQARAVLKGAPGGQAVIASLLALDWYDRDTEGALGRLEGAPAEDPGVQHATAITHLLQGRPDLARPLLASYLAYLEEAGRTMPESPHLLSMLGKVQAALGRKEEAVRAGRRAVELSAKDAWSGPSFVEGLAEIYAWVGEGDQAVELLERLLATPYEQSITSAHLRLDPTWDPLRDHPRFQELVAR